MIIYPAIDLRRGRCVRLRLGDANAETVFSDHPAEVARHWESQGAEWLHVVNLDGALGEQSRTNLKALQHILQTVRIPVQFGGGIRSLEDIERLMDMGVARVILGTIAVHAPEILDQALRRWGPETISVGIDAKNGLVAIHGWRETAPLTALDFGQQVARMGVTRIIYTDTHRDGMLGGVNVAATLQMARQTGLRVIASGGVASLEDIRTLQAHEAEGIEGVIIGMALYQGALDLGSALKIAQGEKGYVS